jgi:hypothetical protein
MYELKEATCDCCRTVYRAVNKKYYCSHCNKYYYVCNRCSEELPQCPGCGVPLKKKSLPLNMMKGENGIEHSLKMNNQKRVRYFGN